MKIIIVLAALLAVGLATKEEHAKKERQLNYHPGNPLVPSFADNVQQQQLYNYLINAANNPLLRLGFANPSASSTATTSSTSTSTIVITCVVSTTACPAGRRRRQVLADLLDQQEEIKPSAVHPVETTPAASLDTTNRDVREADPQFFVHPNQYFNPYKVPGQLESSFSQGSKPLGRQELSTFIDLLNPLVAAENLYSAFVPSYIANILPTIGFPVRQATKAVTQTNVICTYAFSTVMSTASCLAPGGTLPVCPASTAAGR